MRKTLQKEIKNQTLNNKKLSLQLLEKGSSHLKQRNLIGKLEQQAHLGYWEFDLETRKIYCSSGTYSLLGLSSKIQISGSLRIKDFIYPDDFISFKKNIHKLIQSGLPIEGELRLCQSAQKIIWCSYQACLDKRENSLKIIGLFQDISPLISLRQQIYQNRTKFRKQSQKKAVFMAQASHDIQQPLQALSIFAQTLQQEELTPAQQQIIMKMVHSIQSLQNMFNNLLDISKIDANGIRFEPLEFEISQFIEKLAVEYQEIAQQNGISLTIETQKAMTYTDSLILERIIRNLLSNALKFTQTSIVLKTETFSDAIKISICDNGVGISPLEQEKIFQEFYQSDSLLNQKRLGTGLGLAIVKKLAKIINTEIHISSIPNKKTCFSFKIPRLNF